MKKINPTPTHVHDFSKRNGFLFVTSRQSLLMSIVRWFSSGLCLAGPLWKSNSGKSVGKQFRKMQKFLEQEFEK